MFRYIHIIILSSFLCCICACNDKQQTVQETPVLLQEKPADRKKMEPEPVNSNTAGNFEGLVADYESKDRVIWQKPEIVIAQLGNLEGKTVADIGAGTGFFTFRMLAKAEKVIGIDIDQRFITFMDSVKVRMPQKYSDRFESRLAKFDDPLLKPAECDAVMMVNTYGYLENRVEYLKIVKKGMKPGGQLLIIDFKKNNLPIGPSDEYKVALNQVDQELVSAGFNVEKKDRETLDYQYIVLARKPIEQEKK